MNKSFNCSMQKKIESLSKKSEADIDKSKREFAIAFKTGKDTVFEIDYYRCGDNAEPYFSTDATIYYPNHRGVTMVGQCQDVGLKDNKVFYDFYKKWNPKHLHKLTDAELDELETDIEALKKTGYPYVEAEDGDWENRVNSRSSELIRQKLPRSLQNSPIAQKIEAMMFPKSSMQKKKESLSKKSEGIEDHPEDVQKMVKELAEETGNNYEDAAIERYAPGNGICVTFGDEEYYCYAYYSDAEKASNERVKQILDDNGIEGLDVDIEQFVDVSWFDDAKHDYAEFYVSGIKTSEPERYKEEFGDLDEEDAVEQYLEGEEEDSIQWYIKNYGEKDFNELVKEKGLVDLDALAEYITEADGPANELARYDGEEIELPCGYYCYRYE